MHKELGLARNPLLPILAQPAAGNQVMDVRMVAQIARPGLQHPQHPNLCADEALIPGQLLQRRG